jgi:hypothetical protein
MSYKATERESEKEVSLSKEQLQVTIDETITTQNGVLFALPAVVFRGAYSGRDLIAKNSGFTPFAQFILYQNRPKNRCR